jgi:hypothetical protein
LAVIEKVGVEGETEQAEVAPAADLFMDVDHKVPLVIVVQVDATLALPDKRSTILGKRDSDGLIPRAANRFFAEPCWKRCAAADARQREG